MNSSYIPLEVIKIRSDTSNTKSFILRQIHGAPITYKPGQFLTLVFDKQYGEERRSYSISSTPDLNEPLTITVKRIPNGEYSRFLFDYVKVGDVLFTIGAAGFFTLPKEPAQYVQFFFLAAGSGITPILPLIRTILHTNLSAQVTLIYSNRSADDTIFLHELTDLEKRFSNNFQIEFLYSSAQNLFKARLTKLLLMQYLHEWVVHKDTALFYLCGPFQYMQMANITLLTEGVPSDNIRKENFSTEKPVIKELPPDVNSHSVFISYEGNTYSLIVQYPVTILEAAKRLGIILPYSCEAGKCGTCSATCLKGKVWHAYNEVLLDRELENGRILTCTGYPYGEEDVVITFSSAGI